MYSGVLTWAVNNPDDFRPIAYTSGRLSNTQQRWSATEKEHFAVYQSALKFDLYLRGAECMLCCNYKSLEPFLSKCTKIPKLDQWTMELANCNITFAHIKSSNNILADAISRLKMLDVYKDPIEDPKMLKVRDIEQHITEVNTNKIHLNNNVLCTEQKCNATYKKLASQSHHSNKIPFNTVVISADGILQKQKSIFMVWNMTLP